MTLETYLIYLLALAAFFATHPDTSQLLVMSNSLRHGLRASMATVAGDLTANSLQITAAAFGVTAVIAVSAEALSIVKWIGVAYLVWIGMSLLISKSKDLSKSQLPAHRGKLFRQGFFTSSANPYAVVFFGALFPQFIDPTVAIWPQLLILGSTYLFVDGVILIAWGWVAERTVGKIRSLTGVWVNRISGCLMIAAAALLGSRDLAMEPSQ